MARSLQIIEKFSIFTATDCNSAGHSRFADSMNKPLDIKSSFPYRAAFKLAASDAWGWGRQPLQKIIKNSYLSVEMQLTTIWCSPTWKAQLVQISLWAQDWFILVIIMTKDPIEVIGWESRSRSCEFKSRDWILDGQFSYFYCCTIELFEMTNINETEVGIGP